MGATIEVFNVGVYYVPKHLEDKCNNCFTHVGYYGVSTFTCYCHGVSNFGQYFKQRFASTPRAIVLKQLAIFQRDSIITLCRKRSTINFISGVGVTRYISRSCYRRGRACG